MPEQTEHRTTPDLEAIRAELATAEELERKVDGFGDLAAHRAIAARSALGRHVPALVAELEQLRIDRAKWAWRAGAARGAAQEIVSLVPSGKRRDEAAEMVAELDRGPFPSVPEQREGSDA